MISFPEVYAVYRKAPSMDFTSFEFLEFIWPELDHVYVYMANKNFETEAWQAWEFNRDSDTTDDEVRALLDEYDHDLYFCPHGFTKKGRRQGNAATTDLLHADLDEVDPRGLALRPSIAWETSPGRYQAIWFLDGRIGEEKFHKLNKALTYAIGADK